MKTAAAILVEQKHPLVLDEVEIPPLAHGQVLVQIHVSRLGETQIGEIDGGNGPDRFLPRLLGQEGGGLVMETGPEVRHVKPGDRVVLHGRPGNGLEARPAVYGWNGQKAGGGLIATFNEYAVISENRLTVVPPGTDFEVCALLADTLTTGFGIVANDAKVRLGESLVIVGCGGIGLGVVLGARLAGANPIIAVDLHHHKLRKASAYGATHVINSSNNDFALEVRRILEGHDPDIVIDGTGNPPVLEKSLSLMRKTGRCVTFGVMSHDKMPSVTNRSNGFTVSDGGGSRPAEDIPRYLRLMRDGCYDVTGFVSHRIPLSEINEAAAKMRSGEVIHCLIHFRHK